MYLITSEQIRACRAILRWTIDDLSKKSGVSPSTLKRIEKASGIPNCRVENMEQVKNAFEATGKVALPNSETIVLKTEDE